MRNNRGSNEKDETKRLGAATHCGATHGQRKLFLERTVVWCMALRARHRDSVSRPTAQSAQWYNTRPSRTRATSPRSHIRTNAESGVWYALCLVPVSQRGGRHGRCCTSCIFSSGASHASAIILGGDLPLRGPPCLVLNGDLTADGMLMDPAPSKHLYLWKGGYAFWWLLAFIKATNGEALLRTQPRLSASVKRHSCSLPVVE